MNYIRLLGAGGQARTYLARRDGFLVACKETGNIGALEKEGMILKEVDNEKIVKYMQFYRDKKKGYLIMEYVEGMNLAEILSDHYLLGRDKKMNILTQTAEGMAYLHSMKRPVLHRDLKPENVMVDSNGRVKIVDFGCACYVDEPDGKIVGTKGYAAGEQMIKPSEEHEDGIFPGLYSDVFSFGRLMHYMFTGDSPYLPPFVKPQIREYDKSFDRRLSGLVNACVEQDAADRPPDMRYVLHELQKITQKRNIFQMIGRINSKGLYQKEFTYEKNILLR